MTTRPASSACATPRTGIFHRTAPRPLSQWSYSAPPMGCASGTASRSFRAVWPNAGWRLARPTTRHSGTRPKWHSRPTFARCSKGTTAGGSCWTPSSSASHIATGSLDGATGHDRGVPMKPVDASLAFLRRWYRDEARVLTAIEPEHGFIRTEAFAAEDQYGQRRFVESWRAERGIYFQVNPDLRAVADIETKGKKEHISRAIALHCDLDSFKGDENREEGKARVLRKLTEQ